MAALPVLSPINTVALIAAGAEQGRVANYLPYGRSS
jgi:hypothetical protein